MQKNICKILLMLTILSTFCVQAHSSHRYWKYPISTSQEPKELLNQFPQTNFAKLKSGTLIKFPWHIWEARVLQLGGAVDYDRMAALLKPHGVEPLRVRDLPTFPQLQQIASLSPDIDAATLGEKALVLIHTSDWMTSSGPIKPTGLFVWVKNPAKCTDKNIECGQVGLYYWKYFVDTKLAFDTGRQLWGMTKRMAQTSTAYNGVNKGFQAYRKRRHEVSMLWNRKDRSQLFPSVADAQDVTPISPVSNVGPGQTINRLVFSGDLTAGEYNSNLDQFKLGRRGIFSKTLRKVNFEPFIWFYYSDLNAAFVMNKIRRK